MKVLITPQFNASMQKLSGPEQTEVVQMFSLASSLEKEQLLSSPLITKLNSSESDLYTLRTRSTRVFCIFDNAGDLLFVDVAAAKDRWVDEIQTAQKEKTLFGHKGDPVAYIATDDENTIYSFDGQPLAYLEKDNIYGFNGLHLGWFEDGIVWNHSGERVGFISSSCPAFTKFEPFKGFKRFKPFKNFRKFAPFKPFKKHSNSSISLLNFLQQGQK